MSIEGEPKTQPVDGKQAILSLALFASEQLIIHAPELVSVLSSAFTRDSVTLEEVRSRRLAIERQQFRDLVSNSELPEDLEPTPAVSPGTP